MSASITLRRELTLDAAPDQLWPLIANTGRFNRALGLSRMEPDGSGTDFSRRAGLRVLGVKLRWQELPFEWVENRYYRVVRHFEGTPIASVEGGIRLEPEGGGTKVVIDSIFTPRGALGRWLIRAGAGNKIVGDAEALVRRFGSYFAGRSEAFPARRTKSPVLPAFKTKAAAMRKSPAAGAAAERLLDLIARGHDDELSRMRPFELADAWALPRLEVLRACLYGVKEGLLDLSWEVLCPNCAAPQKPLRSLKELGSQAHCDTCRIDYSADFDDSVELRFSVHPGARKIETAVFCVGSPVHSPFAVFQLGLSPGERREVELELGAESYVLRDLFSRRQRALRPAQGGPSTVALEAGAEKPAAFSPGRIRLDLSAGPQGALLRLEKEGWKERGAKASFVTALQEFRDLFSAEVLSPGVEIGVKNLALLFSDLRDSTALYEKVGDAAAYALVRDHFIFLGEIVERRRGAIVKTIGDAVMAVFSSAKDGLEAALEIQERLPEFNERAGSRPGLSIKLGLHQGPTIAIRGADAIDYFGTTVNVAARIQNESLGEDLVISRAVYADSATAEVLKRRSWASSPFTIKLKGLGDAFELWRIERETARA